MPSAGSDDDSEGGEGGVGESKHSEEGTNPSRPKDIGGGDCGAFSLTAINLEEGPKILDESKNDEEGEAECV